MIKKAIIILCASAFYNGLIILYALLVKISDAADVIGLARRSYNRDTTRKYIY